MYDPRFEKAVQHKMEELEIRPSESVWVNIEKTVSAERRRRGAPFFWRLFIATMLVGGVVTGYYFGEKAGRRSVAPATARAGTAGGAKASASDPSGPPETRNKQVEVSKTPAAASAASKKKYTRTTTSDDSVIHATIVSKQTAEERFADEAKTSADEAKTSSDEAKTSSDESKTSSDEAKTSVTGNSRIGAYLYTPGLEEQRYGVRVQGASLKTNKNMVSLNTLSQVRRPWEAGFVAGGGFDRLNRLDGGQAGNAASYTASSFYGLTRAATKTDISDVRPGASFYAGIYLQKQVSNRWTFHTGLDLHYYSTSVSIGQQLNVIASPAASLLNQTALAAAPAPLVFTVGDLQNFVNRYYLLELPVSMQYRINRSKLLPLFVEGGAAVSRLMGANAIFYNPSTGLYLKNENVLNKTQFNISSALLVGLPFHGIRIQAGPEVQYGLTPLINGQGLGDQHFFYAGVRLVVLPGRK
ncbi:MAG TPA: hypothetical protein VGQ51_12620 [Puia sp.]|nr:hypothetical protein [Puia sp.]